MTEVDTFATKSAMTVQGQGDANFASGLLSNPLAGVAPVSKLTLVGAQSSTVGTALNSLLDKQGCAGQTSRLGSGGREIKLLRLRVARQQRQRARREDKGQSKGQDEGVQARG